MLRLSQPHASVRWLWDLLTRKQSHRFQCERRASSLSSERTGRRAGRRECFLIPVKQRPLRRRFYPEAPRAHCLAKKVKHFFLKQTKKMHLCSFLKLNPGVCPRVLRPLRLLFSLSWTLYFEQTLLGELAFFKNVIVSPRLRW